MRSNCRSLILTTVLFVPSHLLTQEAAESVTQQSRPAAKKPLAQGGISGHVVCADTHGPARGAHVLVIPIDTLGQGDQIEENDQPHMAVTGLDGTDRLGPPRISCGTTARPV